jgi:hypothetical protein
VTEVSAAATWMQEGWHSSTATLRSGGGSGTQRLIWNGPLVSCRNSDTHVAITLATCATLRTRPFRRHWRLQSERHRRRSSHWRHEYWDLGSDRCRKSDGTSQRVMRGVVHHQSIVDSCRVSLWESCRVIMLRGYEEERDRQVSLQTRDAGGGHGGSNN